MRSPCASVAVAGILAATLTGCTSSPPVALPRCSPASPPATSEAQASVYTVDNGATICLPVGLKLSIYLAVPIALATRGWAPITTSDSTILKSQPATTAPAPAAVVGIFKGERRGVATVASYLPPCPGPAASCPVAERWTVTVVVGGTPPTPGT